MWKDIPNFEGQYEVSDNGDVRSVNRIVTDRFGKTYGLKGRILKTNKTKNGYLLVHLSKNGQVTPVYIHKIVAKLFVSNPNNLPVVNHKDGNKENCKASNLEWVTYSENNQHAYDTGLHPKGEQQYKAKLTEANIREIRNLGKYGTLQSIADKYGVSKATIRDVLLFRTWKGVV